MHKCLIFPNQIMPKTQAAWLLNVSNNLNYECNNILGNNTCMKNSDKQSL